MTSYPLKELSTARAKELSETLLLHHDLQSAMSAMKIWSTKTAANAELSPDDVVICGSLFRDAVVQFVGCFDKSNKFALVDSEIYQSEHAAYFQWLQDLRDAYAAHKFGALRQCVVGILVDPEKGVVGVGFQTGVYSGPVSQGGPQFLEFMQIAASFITNKIDRLQAEVLREASLLPPDKLASLQNAKVYGIDANEVRTTRPGLQSKRTGKPPSVRQ